MSSPEVKIRLSSSARRRQKEDEEGEVSNPHAERVVHARVIGDGHEVNTKPSHPNFANFSESCRLAGMPVCVPQLTPRHTNCESLLILSFVRRRPETS